MSDTEKPVYNLVEILHLVQEIKDSTKFYAGNLNRSLMTLTFDTMTFKILSVHLCLVLNACVQFS